MKQGLKDRKKRDIKMNRLVARGKKKKKDFQREKCLERGTLGWIL